MGYPVCKQELRKRKGSCKQKAEKARSWGQPLQRGKPQTGVVGTTS